MDFDEWFRKRFYKGSLFPDIDAMIRDVEKEFEHSFKEMEDRIPKHFVRERKLPDGSLEKEWGPFVYGYSMTLGPDGKPVIREFGNMKPGPGEATGIEFKGETQPLVDVLDQGQELKVVAELPGVEKQDIRLEATDGTLVISAERGSRKYHEEVRLPASVDSNEARSTFKNGVLEVTLKKKDTAQGRRRIEIG